MSAVVHLPKSVPLVYHLLTKRLQFSAEPISQEAYIVSCRLTGRGKSGIRILGDRPREKAGILGDFLGTDPAQALEIGASAERFGKDKLSVKRRYSADEARLRKIYADFQSL